MQKPLRKLALLLSLGLTAVLAHSQQKDSLTTAPVTVLEQANQAHQRGDHAMAIATLQKYLKTSPGDDDARTALARAQLAAGSPAEAKSTIDEVLKRSPNSTDALLLRGLVNRRGRKKDAARADFQRVVQLAPDYCDAHLFLVSGYLDDNDTSAAVKTMEAMPETCRSADSSTSPGSPTTYARILRRLELAANPQLGCDPRWWNDRGPWPNEGEDPRLAEVRRLLAADEVSAAEKLVDQVLDESPADADAHLLKARIEVRRAKYAEAEKRLEAILRRNESYGYCDVRLLLATARLALKKTDDAKSAITDCPHCAAQPEAQRLLQQMPQ